MNFKILMVVCLGMGLWLYCIANLSEGSQAPLRSERIGAMFLTKQNTAENHWIPPIDASAPEKTKTATFALG
jgi:hypothetical protein